MVQCVSVWVHFWERRAGCENKHGRTISVASCEQCTVWVCTVHSAQCTVHSAQCALSLPKKEDLYFYTLSDQIFFNLFPISDEWWSRNFRRESVPTSGFSDSHFRPSERVIARIAVLSLTFGKGNSLSLSWYLVCNFIFVITVFCHKLMHFWV